jgi:hypothetical protein
MCTRGGVIFSKAVQFQHFAAKHLEKPAFKAAFHRESSEANKKQMEWNVGLLGDAHKMVEVEIAERTWPYEVNSPGRNKRHSFIHSTTPRSKSAEIP